jgi:hypothetical protein
MGKVSFMPEAWQEGGGLWNNVDVRFTNCRFESEWTAGGKRQASPAFVSDLVFIDDASVNEAGWSLGSTKDYQASADGVKPAATGDYVVGAAARKSSNFYFLVTSMIEALPDATKAEDMERILGEGAASAWNGMEAHIIRQTVEREGLEKKKNAQGKEMDFTVPVIDSILKVPGGKKAAPGTKTPAKAGAKAGAEAPNMDEAARAKVNEVLDANGGSMIRTALAQAAFKATADAKLKQPLAKLIYEKAWLTAQSEAGGWTFDAETDTVTKGGGEEAEFVPE